MIESKERIGDRIDAHVQRMNLASRTVDLFTHLDTAGDLWDRIELGKSGWCDACACPRSGLGWRRDLAELKESLPPEVPMPHIYLCELHTSGAGALGDEEAEQAQEEGDIFPVLSVRLG